MEITIRLYATMKDVAKQPRITVSLPDVANVQILRDAIREQYPSLAPNMETAVVAVNRSFADPSEPISAGDEVAIFPPVSGGACEVNGE